jgi:phenylacetate-CoA ligase
LLHNSFSYHFTPAGAMLESGGHALGCTVFPAGVGQTEQQVQSLLALGASAYCGTPSFLGILLDKAAVMGLQLPHLRHALVSGEAVTPALQARFKQAGINAKQCYATADIGLIAYETSALDGLVLDEHVWVEILDVNDKPVADGEVGEIVVTVLNPDYPLLRFGTGDLSAIVPASRTAPDPCGRTQLRLRGWLGRVDQATKVRGLFVHPQQVQDIVKRHAQILRGRLLISQLAGEDQMILQCECAQPDQALALAIQNSVRECTKLRAQVQWLTPATLPEDGQIIVDQRAKILP